MQKLKLDIYWMHCSSCSKLIEMNLGKNESIKSSVINSANNKWLVEYDETKITPLEIIEIINKSGYKAEAEKKEIIDFSKVWYKKTVFWFILSIPLIIFMIYDFISLPFKEDIMQYMAIVGFFIATIIQFSIWLDFYKWFFAALKQKTFNMYSLIAIWTSTAYFYSLYSFLKYILENWSLIWDIHGIYFEVSALLITFVCLWKYLENKAKAHTNDAVKKLMWLAPKTAFVKRGENFMEISREDIKVWDIVLVKPWESIPVDWIITKWTSTLDESMLTWESMWVEKSIWDEIFAWTLNSLKSFEFGATKVWAWTFLSQIVTLLEEAALSKAEIEWFADKVSRFFVPIVLVLALLTFLVWFFLLNSSFESALLFATSVVVIACPCALWLATPTAIMVWTWLWAKSWILVKWWSALEKAYKINAIILDKTWTITIWKPIITDTITFEGFEKEKLLEIIYSLENNSTHPIAQAVCNYAKENNISLKEVSSFEVENWKWIIWEIKGKKYKVWNLKLFPDFSNFLSKWEVSEFHFSLENGWVFEFVKKIEKNPWLEDIYKIYNHFENEWKTTMLVEENWKIIWIFAVSDEVKETSKEAIKNLQDKWIEVFMVTWDNKKTAQIVWEKVWIKKENIFAETLPQEKSEIVKSLKEKWFNIWMVWDGINDSIALSLADLWIWMWSWSDIALESSDVVLVKNDLEDIEKMLHLSKASIWKIKQNLFFSLFYNSMWIPIAAWVFVFAWLELKPEFAGLAMILSSISVVLNSLSLKYSLKNKYISYIIVLFLIAFFSIIFIIFAYLSKNV